MMKIMRLKTFYVCITLLFISGVIQLIGCQPSQERAGPDDSGETKTPDAPGESETSDPQENPPYSGYEFPEADLGGYTFRIFNATTFGDDRWSSIELTAEQETGDPVNDAVYRRNTLIEEKFNFTITEQIEDRDIVGAKVTRAALAGSDDWDAVFVGPVVCASMAARGLFLDLNAISNLSLGSPWWDQNARQSFSLDGALMFTATDAHINNCGYMWMTFYNKAIIQDMGMPDLYQVVRDGKWTLDAMHDYAKAAARDLDGDGKFTGADCFGVTSFPQCILAFTVGMDFRPITLDNSGYPVINRPSERFVSGAEKVRDFLNRETGLFLGAEKIAGTAGMDQMTISAQVFAARKALFFVDVLASFWGLRNMDDDYGMIPIPKYDEAQKNYYSWMGIAAPTVMIPKPCVDPERSGLVLDALSAVSSIVLMDGFYKVTVLRKASRDEESTEMLELIRANRVFDIAAVYNWGELFNGYRDNIYDLKNESLMTVYERREGATVKAIEATMDAFRTANK